MIHLIHFMHGIIPILYLIIAMQFFYAFNQKNVPPKAKHALMSLVIIFITCGICGYVLDLHNNSYIVLFFHSLLIISCIVFVSTNQASIVVNTMHEKLNTSKE